MSWPRRGSDLDAALPNCVEPTWHLLCVDCERATLVVFAYAVYATQTAAKWQAKF